MPTKTPTFTSKRRVSPRPAGDFEPTPTTVPGAKVVTTPALREMVGKKPPPLDHRCRTWRRGYSGCSMDRRPGFPSDAGNADLRNLRSEGTAGALDNPVVVMGTGPYDWYAYNATLTLVSLGYRNVRWFRGGEESWAATGMKSEDRRRSLTLYEATRL